MKFKILYSSMSIVLLLFFSNHLYAAHTTVVRGDTIKSVVRAYIEKNMSWPGGAVRIEFPDRVSDVSLTGERITYLVRSRRNKAFIGNCVFSVSFYRNGVFIREKTVRARLDVSMGVVVSTRTLLRNIKIASNDVKLVKRWFNRIPLNIISNLDGVVGKRLRTSIKPNTEVTRNMVRNIPVVKRGKPVKIVFENDSMRITTIGLSEQDGALGDLVRIKNVSSKKTIYARVMGSSLVRVEF